MDCEHIVGEWLYYEDTCVVTLEELKDTIDDYNEYRLPHDEEITLHDCADKRENTSFTRFEFCPMCGEKIDWKKIREVE